MANMQRQLQGKIIVITGATGGIGLETARMAARFGAIPILTGRDQEKLAAASAQIGDSRHGAYVLDVTEAPQAERVMEEIVRDFDRIDVLVNNAGYGEFVRFQDTRPEQFREMMEVNYFGVIGSIRAALPHMLAGGGGQIVNVASMAGKIGSPKASAYSATKHAVLGLTNCLRHELAGTGIAVSAVNPGPVDTAFFDRADPGGTYKHNVGFFLLTPERVARAVLQVIASRRMELDLPFTAALGTKLYQLFPRMLDGVFRRIVDRK